jgi:hypothetical protein
MSALTIKDLEVAKELSREERAAVRGGNQGNAAVSTIGQLQSVMVPVATLAGAGSAVNNDVHVDASQDASIDTRQNNGDRLSFLALIPFGLR